ncbi:hypothetical protein SGFS_009780 [Streptomyces graminofaciens]|uniref:Uncharacterized protein n=1 Tax=Streptomyces graminofaciens TaxID=68212 RepID=A0ABN5V928_9ACTN|nr:hypothetical protein SGFS_009780 [Streptomyces graminofaciens]
MSGPLPRAREQRELQPLQRTGECGITRNADLTAQDVRADGELLQVTGVDVVPGRGHRLVVADVPFRAAQDPDQGGGAAGRLVEVVLTLCTHGRVAGQDLRQP